MRRAGRRRERRRPCTLLVALLAAGACTMAAHPKAATAGPDPPASPLPGPVAPLPRTVAGLPFARGMVYGIFSREGVDFHRENLEALADLGVDSVQIIVPRSVHTIHSTSLSAADRWVTPSPTSLEQAVAEAHRLGMRVFLFPIVYIEDLEGEEWRGALRPMDWEVWWRNYAGFILEEARWAAAHGVEIFSVGSELCSTEHRTRSWRELIARVREVFPGLVTYSANWDHLQVMEFGDALDFLGMNAYFEIGEAEPTLDRLLARWQPILDRVEAWQSAHGRPVVVTEIGYPSRRGGTVDPWNYLAAGEPAPDEQDLGYRAFLQAWQGRPWFAGAYFYLWWDDADDGGRGYTPRGKPAAATLRRWYTLREP